MIEIDGSYGEGGGQLLRYAMALAALLNKEVRIYNIRAKRDNPGLRHQHLAVVRTISELVNAEIEGLYVGSKELFIKPKGKPKGGRLEVDIGTAGSISLFLQAVIPVLAFTSSEVILKVRGGTDVKWAPPIQYFHYVLLSLLRELGVKVDLKLLRRGFYPQGSGLVEVRVHPSYPLQAVSLTKSGRLEEIRGVSYVANLPRHIAERQAAAATETLRQAGLGSYISEIEIDTDTPAVGVGSGIVLIGMYEHSIVGADALGERGKKAEIVGREAADKLAKVLRHGAPVDPHALDNLILYMSLAKGVSRVVSSEMTSHAETAVWLCSRMTGARFNVRNEDHNIVVEAEGIGLQSLL